METNNKIQYLIVDTSAFIKNAPLQDIGVNIITEQDVVNEITNKRQLRRLVVLPYDLSVESAFPENIKFVTEFAKKTGDYTSLSATDVKVIALTYQLEKEKVGTEHLKETPTIVKTINSAKHNKNSSKPIVGFYIPKKKSKKTSKTKDKKNVIENEEEVYVDSLLVNEVDIKENEEGQEEKENKNDDECLEDEEDRFSSDTTESSDDEYVSNNETATSDVDDNVDIETKDLAEKFSNLNCEPSQLEIQSEDGNTHNVDDILATISDEENKDSLEESNESDDDCNNDNDWITPNNIKNVRKQMDSDVLKEKSATVACLTMDFAMQNVLMQIGLNVASLDGKVIKQMRTFIFRCYACFKTTSIMTKVFCPNCGNKTLKKVAISLDDNGKQQIHINTRRPLTAKGKKFSLPKPQGGKHANNPILCEDQPMPQQRISKLARTKNDPLYDDYIAGFSPFVTRDVYSKSAMLGIRSNGGVKYWMKKNPNESRKKRK
ncbi:PREDICTED: RNA-binding protein NOB1 [Polistes canadensis]|uniref:RNA-binding protein NOB1 n=1 Tax=Polistes canadensis TaxID=91411 RepID=UPI000718C712|nr:PREDICTED: RNA-binding protein NOB1 [Polistes canadensis]XP_014616120.1 PREDICTED: RNA-binding protein NOB1 [Polistes canadensis]